MWKPYENAHVHSGYVPHKIIQTEIKPDFLLKTFGSQNIELFIYIGRVLYKKDVLKNFVKFTGKYLCPLFNEVAGLVKKETPTQIFLRDTASEPHRLLITFKVDSKSTRTRVVNGLENRLHCRCFYVNFVEHVLTT